MNALEELLKQIDEGKQFTYLHFWGHKQRSLQVDKACFSQWFVAPFKIDDITYPTAEHYMMAGKARLFDDQVVLKEILTTNDPDIVKRLGRKVKNYDESTWVEHRSQIVVDGNYAKFSQNPKLAKYLLSTADRIIVEASPLDKIWGTGLAQDHPDSNSPHLWQGLNLLGFALMEVRHKLLVEQMN
ncbi:MAG: NADAR family protein [Undibacterium umbellatum]|uniref:NADAR family protein n=1 Tax=Undibacterium umbellatum TaxID=2762300 RepID=UPI003BB755D8